MDFRDGFLQLFPSWRDSFCSSSFGGPSWIAFSNTGASITEIFTLKDFKDFPVWITHDAILGLVTAGYLDYELITVQRNSYYNSIQVECDFLIMSLITYDRERLLGLYSVACRSRPTPSIVAHIRSLGLWRTCRLRYRFRKFRSVPGPVSVSLRTYRGRRAGGGERGVVGEVDGLVQGGLVEGCWVGRGSAGVVNRLGRHAGRDGPAIVFGLLNVRSIERKLDDLLEVRRDNGIDVFFLVETWHSAESVALSRLRAGGYAVVDCPRPHHDEDTLRTNHGGIAAFSVAGIQLKVMALGVLPTTFELLCVRVSSCDSMFVAAIIYRPGSAPVAPLFFRELSDILGRLVVLPDPVFLVGDINIHQERLDDPHANRLNEIITAHGLESRPLPPTHILGGVLSVAAQRSDPQYSEVSVVDVGLSDHHLLRWTRASTRLAPVYRSCVGRVWRSFDVEVFREALSKSRLCQPGWWGGVGINELVDQFHADVTVLLDEMVPMRTNRVRQRPSDPWFDADCRASKRKIRSLEKDFHRAVQSSDAAAADLARVKWYGGRREYRALLRSKRHSFWRARVTAEVGEPRRLWRSVDTLLGRGRALGSDRISAAEFHTFFDSKVEGIRQLSSGAPCPEYSTLPCSGSFEGFRLVNISEVVDAVKHLPNKQCPADPMPTWLLKACVDLLGPFLTCLINVSLSSGVVPDRFRSALVTPLLKKPDLDGSDVRSYRPISNLMVLCKLLEKIAAAQLRAYLDLFDLLPPLQSSYRSNHSTETAVLKVTSDILQEMDRGKLTVLVLLDLSAAFDTVDHHVLLERLRISFGVGGTALLWLSSYLTNRTQSVRTGTAASSPSVVASGVPQGSVLGPLLFILYTADLARLVQRHGLSPHLFADDAQIYGSCMPGATAELQSRVTNCLCDVGRWMCSNRLQLNTSKTEVVWFASARRQHQVPVDPFRVGPDMVTPVHVVRDLGFMLETDLSMRSHVSKTVSSCFSSLRQVRAVRRSVDNSVLLSLVTALVLTRLDYGCSVLSGITDQQLDKLQSVLHAAARLVSYTGKFDSITPVLRDLHWLSVRERIQHRLASLVYKCLHGQGPSYLSTQLRTVSSVDSRRHLRSATAGHLMVPTTLHPTMGGRAFPTVAASAWNGLPSLVTHSESLCIFKRRLKTFLFSRSYLP